MTNPIPWWVYTVHILVHVNIVYPAVIGEPNKEEGPLVDLASKSLAEHLSPKLIDIY